MRRVSIACFCAAAIIDCNGYGESAPPAPSGDASAEAASTNDGGTEAGDAAGAGPLTNGGFESSTIGCSPQWSATSGTAELVGSPTHGGGKACKICSPIAPNGDFFIRARFAIGPGGEWATQAYFRSASQEQVEAYLSLAFEDESGSVSDGTNTRIAVGADWTPAGITFATPAGLGFVVLSAGLSASDGGAPCVVVDDVTLTRF